MTTYFKTCAYANFVSGIFMLAEGDFVWLKIWGAVCLLIGVVIWPLTDFPDDNGHDEFADPHDFPLRG